MRLSFIMTQESPEMDTAINQEVFHGFLLAALAEFAVGLSDVKFSRVSPRERRVQFSQVFFPFETYTSTSESASTFSTPMTDILSRCRKDS